MNINLAKPRDIAALKAIWREVFGDGEEFLNLFFTLVFPHSKAFLALEGGEPVGSAYVLEISSLIEPDGSKRPCPYIYAVGVRNKFRSKGIGRALTLACRDYCCEKYGISCLVPAESGLFDYYSEIAGYAPAFFAKRSEVALSDSEKTNISRLCAADYGDMREKLLAGRGHISLSAAGMEFLEKLCTMSGGGLFRVESGGKSAVAAAEKDGETLYIKELLAPDGSEKHIAKALAAELGCKKVVYTAPSNNGQAEVRVGMLSESREYKYYFGPAFD